MTTLPCPVKHYAGFLSSFTLRAIIEHLQAAVHTGGRQCLVCWGMRCLPLTSMDGLPGASPASVEGRGRAVTVSMAPFVTGLGSSTLVRMAVRAADWRLGLNCYVVKKPFP